MDPIGDAVVGAVEVLAEVPMQDPLEGLFLSDRLVAIPAEEIGLPKMVPPPPGVDKGSGISKPIVLN